MNRTETYEHLFVGGGRVTLAMMLNDTTIDVGISFCSPKDQFTRSKGRKIAKGRIVAKSMHTFSLPKKKDSGLLENKDLVVSKFVEMGFDGLGDFPSWVHEAMRRGQYTTIQALRAELASYDDDSCGCC